MSKSILLSATVAAGFMGSDHIRQTLADKPPALGRQCPRSRRTARVVRTLAAVSKLGIVGATALSLASAVATSAFAVGLRGVHGGSAMHVGIGGFRGAQASVDPYCAQRWAYYDPASGKYMDDEGEWRPCP
jgi:BA14K-like protein